MKFICEKCGEVGCGLIDGYCVGEGMDDTVYPDFVLFHQDGELCVRMDLDGPLCLRQHSMTEIACLEEKALKRFLSGINDPSITCKFCSHEVSIEK